MAKVTILGFPELPRVSFMRNPGFPETSQVVFPEDSRLPGRLPGFRAPTREGSCCRVPVSHGAGRCRDWTDCSCPDRCGCWWCMSRVVYPGGGTQAPYPALCTPCPVLPCCTTRHPWLACCVLARCVHGPGCPGCRSGCLTAPGAGLSGALIYLRVTRTRTPRGLPRGGFKRN